jgi:hypothetical protein
MKFSHIREGDQVTSQDKELWEYFAILYKNSNKGIKGRGKDRRISTALPSSAASSSSYTSTSTVAMSRVATNGSTQGAMPGDHRSSRSSSYSSAGAMGEPQSHHAASHHPVQRINEPAAGYPHHHHHAPHQQHHFEDHGNYNNMVFPERKFM